MIIDKMFDMEKYNELKNMVISYSEFEFINSNSDRENFQEVIDNYKYIDGLFGKNVKQSVLLCDDLTRLISSFCEGVNPFDFCYGSNFYKWKESDYSKLEEKRLDIISKNILFEYYIGYRQHAGYRNYITNALCYECYIIHIDERVYDICIKRKEIYCDEYCITNEYFSDECDRDCDCGNNKIIQDPWIIDKVIRVK